MEPPTIDEQGRPDLLNSERAHDLAARMSGLPLATVAEMLLKLQAHALKVGRDEVGVGGSYTK